MKRLDHAKSIAAKLSKLSKVQKIPYANVATAFLIERLLARLLANTQLNKFLVFKGGYVGLRVYNSARYTVDLDALLLNADVKSTLKQTVVAIEKDLDDGTWFLLESQVDLLTQGEYGGVRQTFRAGIGDRPKDITRSQLINFDIGIGDPVTPGPFKIQTHEMIGNSELSWQVYPVETIIAEKLQTLIERGNENSRAKDIFDLYFYLPKADAKILQKAVKQCFAFRDTEMPSGPAEFIASIDQTLLKRGWKNALASIKNPPTFEEAFGSILKELKIFFPAKPNKT